MEFFEVVKNVLSVQYDKAKSHTTLQNLFQLRECYIFYQHGDLLCHLASGSQIRHRAVLNQQS